MGEMAQAGQGIFASLKGLVKTIVSIGHNRLELLLVELQEERWRLFEALLLAGVALILALMCLMVFTMIIVILCIKEDHLWVAVVLGVAYLLGTVICAWLLRTRLSNWIPFAATLAEIKKDKACLEETK